MTAMTQLLRGQQHQLDNYASLTALETPSRQGQQPPLQRRQRCLHINGTTQSRTSITIATMVKMPAHQRQRCHHDEGDDASFTASNESNDYNSTTAETPAHQRRQWRHHDDGKDACINKRAYHGADSAAILLGRMRNRFSCVCRSGVGGRLIWNRLSGDQSPLNQFHRYSFLSFCPPKSPISLVSSSQNCPH